MKKKPEPKKPAAGKTVAAKPVLAIHTPGKPASPFSEFQKRSWAGKPPPKKFSIPKK
jgi:hypothetical protein